MWHKGRICWVHCGEISVQIGKGVALRTPRPACPTGKEYRSTFLCHSGVGPGHQVVNSCRVEDNVYWPTLPAAERYRNFKNDTETKGEFLIITVFTDNSMPGSNLWALLDINPPVVFDGVGKDLMYLSPPIKVYNQCTICGREHATEKELEQHTKEAHLVGKKGKRERREVVESEGEETDDDEADSGKNKRQKVHMVKTLNSSTKPNSPKQHKQHCYRVKEVFKPESE